jgi:DNA-binding MarR family transcriptional regulator
MGRNLGPLERRGLVRLKTSKVDQRERVVHLTSSGTAAIENALPYWRAAQKRVAALLEFETLSVISRSTDGLRSR